MSVFLCIRLYKVAWADPGVSSCNFLERLYIWVQIINATQAVLDSGLELDLWPCFMKWDLTNYLVPEGSNTSITSIMGTLGPLRKLEDFFDVISQEES